MRWLLHGKFDPTVAEAFIAHGHQTQTLADVGVAEDAPAEDVLAAAHKGQLDLLTSDADTATRTFEANIPFARSIALISTNCEPGPGIERFFERYPPARARSAVHHYPKPRKSPATARSKIRSFSACHCS